MKVKSAEHVHPLVVTAMNTELIGMIPSSPGLPGAILNMFTSTYRPSRGIADNAVAGQSTSYWPGMKATELRAQ